MKSFFSLSILLLLSSMMSFGQKYFVPAVGGLKNANDGKEYYLVEMEGKDSLQIYNALGAMAKDIFTGTDDEILEKEPGKYLKVRGIAKNSVCSKSFDLEFDLEFKIKNDRYIFLYSKFNILSSKGTGYRIVMQKGSNLLAKEQTYMFNKKGAVSMQKSCYKSIIKATDFFSAIFDITDEYEKYASKSSDEDSGW